MYQELTCVNTPLSVCVRNSGKLPISIQNHYDHWLKYHGRRGTFYEDGIKQHLKDMRIHRFRTHIRKKTLGDVRLPSLRSMKIRKKKSSKSGTMSDVFEMYDDIVEVGSNWWRGTPLPNINDEEANTTLIDEIIQPPFSDCTNLDVNIPLLMKKVRTISDNEISEFFPPKTLHIYLSSSNNDMTAERMNLERTVWPHLRQLCLKYNRELIIHDHHTFYTQLMSTGWKKYIQEIEKSADLCINQRSRHIKAVILLGDYLDTQEPPDSLNEKEMSEIKFKIQKDHEEIKRLQEKIQTLKVYQQQMKQSSFKSDVPMGSYNETESLKTDHGEKLKLGIENETINSEISLISRSIDQLNYKTNLSIIEQWYRKRLEMEDIYYLQPERDLIKELKSMDSEQVKNGTTQWKNIREQLCFITSSYCSDIMDEQKTPFQKELSILEGLMISNQCVVVTRTFSKIIADDAVMSLKSEMLSKINEKYQIRFELENDDDGLVSTKNHSSYLNHLSCNLQNILEKDIIQNLEEQDKGFQESISNTNNDSINGPNKILLYLELEAQLKALNLNYLSSEKLLSEMGEVITNIKERIISSSSSTILLVGRPLSGKSSVMAAFIKLFKENPFSLDTLFVYRILGCSFQSVTMVGLLRSICVQIIFETGLDMKVPQDFSDLKTMFYQLTILIKFPVILCIDGLDLLTDAETSSSFDWLPIQNENFSLIISCSTDNSTFKFLQNMLDSSKKEYTKEEIAELSDKTIEDYIHSYTKAEMFSLTTDQEVVIRDQCLTDRYLGFVQSALKIAKNWTPTSSLPRLGSKLEQNIFLFLTKLEDAYGEPIIRRLIGYMTCFKNGCTINELVDLMTLDDIVQKHIAMIYGCKDFRYTFGLLRFVLAALEEMTQTFLDEAGLWTIKWRNSVYFKAATERYLLQKDKAPSYHQVVAQYFMNDPKNQEVLSKFVEDGKLPNYSEYLMKQGLLYSGEYKHNSKQFNLRKVSQLPYHLLQSQSNKLVKVLCYFDFHWLQGVVSSFGCLKLIEDLQLAYRTEPEDMELPLLLSALDMSKVTLLKDPCQLGGQLLGRITDIVIQDRSSLEPPKFPNLDHLYKSICHNEWLTAIVPSRSCMQSPDKQDFTTLGYHFGNVTSFLLDDSATKILASADTGVVYTWNVTNNRITSIILGVGKNIFQMLLGHQNRTLITALPEFIEMWAYEEKVILKRLTMLYDMYSLTISADRSIFSALFFGIGWLGSWNIETTELLVSKKLPLDTSLNCDGRIVTMDVCKDFLALAAVKHDNKAVLIDVRNGEINTKVLKCKEEGSAIAFVSHSPRYYVTCNKGLSTKDYLSIIYYVDLFDCDSLLLVRRIDGCILDCVVSLAVDSAGTHVITVNADKGANITDVSLWNMESSDHKHYLEAPCIFDKVQCTDLSRIFLLNKGSSVIYKANVLASKNTKIERRRRLVLDKYALNDCYVFVRSEDNVFMDVYNAMRNEGKGEKLRRLTGFAGLNDIILPYIEKLIILSERCYSPVTPDCKDVFQIIKTYDLTLDRIVQTTTNVFIYPSRKNEFFVLANDILAGLSDNRSHIVYWNLLTGQIQRRIRPTPLLFSGHRQSLVGSGGSLQPSPDAVTLSPSVELSIHELVIDTILVSASLTTLVAAYFTRFLCVFSLTEECHKVNLIGDCQLLHLQTAAITQSGAFLVQNNYNENCLRTFLTLWNTETGLADNSLPVDNNILSVAISADGTYVGFIEEKVGGVIWNTSGKRQKLFYRLPGDEQIGFKDTCSNHKMEFTSNDERLLVSTGRSFHLWSIFSDHCDIIGSFQPDYLIESFTFCCEDLVLAFLLKGSNDLCTIKLSKDHLDKRMMKQDYLKYMEKDLYGIDDKRCED